MSLVTILILDNIVNEIRDLGSPTTSRDADFTMRRISSSYGNGNHSQSSNPLRAVLIIMDMSSMGKHIRFSLDAGVVTPYSS